MEGVLVELEIKLRRFTQHAKIIMWVSIISIFNPPLYLIALIYFLIYNGKLSQLKSLKSVGNTFLSLKSKSLKQLKHFKKDCEPLEQGIATLLIAHKQMVTALIVTAAVLVIIISAIFIINSNGPYFT